MSANYQVVNNTGDVHPKAVLRRQIDFFNGLQEFFKKNGWTNGCYARDANGNPEFPCFSSAVSYSVLGRMTNYIHVVRRIPFDPLEFYWYLNRYLEEWAGIKPLIHSGYVGMPIVIWNETIARTKDDVFILLGGLVKWLTRMINEPFPKQPVEFRP